LLRCVHNLPGIDNPNAAIAPIDVIPEMRRPHRPQRAHANRRIVRDPRFPAQC